MYRIYVFLLALMATGTLWSQNANLQIIHNSPTPGTDSGPAVDIYANDALLVDNFDFRTATDFISVAPGIYEIAVAPDTSTSSASAIATFAGVVLEADSNYVVVATGIVGDANTPFNLAISDIGQMMSSADDLVAINAFHGSPDAPNVDINARGVGNLFADLPFGDFSGYTEVPAASYFLDVKPAGEDAVVATFQADLSNLGGGAAVVFASGLLGNTPNFGLFAALPDNTVIELPATAIPEGLVINEVDYDMPGSDDAEFVELLNTSSEPVSLGGVEVLFVNGSNSETYSTITLPDSTLAAGDYFVICFSTDNVANCDLNVSGSIQNGSPDAIALQFGGSLLLDALSYEGDVEGFVEGTGSGLEDVGAADEVNKGLSRFPDGADSDSNSDDFIFACVTPGEANTDANMSCQVQGMVRLQIIHNSPAAGTDSGPTVDIYANDALLFDDLAFRSATEFVDVMADTFTIAIAPDNSTSSADAIATFPGVIFEDRESYVVVANGIVGDDTTPFELAVTDMGQEFATSSSGNFDFNVFHGSPDAPAVDVNVTDGANLVDSLSYSDFSGYLGVPAAAYSLDVANAETDEVVATFDVDLSLLAGSAATVFASGLLGDTPGFGLFAAFADGTVVEFPQAVPDSARVQIIHNSPTPGTESGPTVDIYANDALLYDDVPFRAATAFASLPEGTYDLAVAPDTSTSSASAIATFQGVVLEGDSTYVVIANGVVGDANTPFNLAISDMGREAATDPANVDFNVFHGSPDAPNVDVNVNDGASLVTDLTFGAFSGYLGVPAGPYLLDVADAATGQVVATFDVDLTGLDGGAATVFASGLLSDTPNFGLFAALPDGTVVEFPDTTLTPDSARVQIIHNSPTPGTESGPTVDIYANDALLYDDVPFRAATAFASLPEGTYDLAVAPDTSTSSASAIATFQGVVLEGDSTYVVIANGVVGDANTPFNLAISDMGREAATDPANVDFNVFHGSPDAPNVDVSLNGGGILVPNLPFGIFSDYLSVPVGPYLLDVADAATNQVVATFDVDLTGLDGGAATVFASGLLSDTPNFGLFAALPDGTVVEFPDTTVTPDTARVQIIHNSPTSDTQTGPTVDIYANGALLVDDLAFRNATPFVDVVAGVYDIAVAPDTSTSAESAIATFSDVVFAADMTYTVVANGIVGNGNTPFALEVNDMAREASSGAPDVDFNVFHGSPNAPAVSIDIQGVGNVVDGIEFGQFSDYVTAPEASYLIDLIITESGLLAETYQADLTGLGGGAATVFASGQLGTIGPDFGIFAALPDGSVVEFPVVEFAQVQVIHNAPTPATETGPTVDIWANDVLLIDNFEFRTATPFLDVVAGTYDIAVAPDTSTSPASAIATFPGVTFGADTGYVVTAYGVVGNQLTPFDLAIRENALTESGDSSIVSIQGFHGSPDVPPVDVILADGSNLISNLSYSNYSMDYNQLAPGRYVVGLGLAGTGAILGNIALDINGRGGEAVTLIASGFFASTPTVGIYAVFADGTVEILPGVSFADLQVVHNSPAVGTDSGPTVDIYANGALLLDDFAFRTASPFTTVESGDYTIAVALDNSTSADDAIATFDLTLGADTSYIVVANGIVGDPDAPFDLEVFANARQEADASGVDLLAFHGSPNAPTVDITADGVGVLFDDITYTDFQGYLNVPAGEYTLNVTPGDDNDNALFSYAADLTDLEGGAGLAFASGLVADMPGFGLFVALPDGTVIELPLVTSINALNDEFATFDIMPNPAVESALINFELTESLDLRVNLFNAQGQLVRTDRIGRYAAGTHSYRLPVSTLDAGIYYVSFSNGNRQITRRLVVGN